MSNLIIRPVCEADFEQWLILWDSYNRFYGRSGPTALPIEITKTTWSRFLNENETMYALVADQEGELVGLTHFLFHRSTSWIADTCYLQDLFTNENCRGRGIGRALIEAVYEHAKTACLGRVYWQTQETNATAIELYKKIADRSGFIVYQKNL